MYSGKNVAELMAVADHDPEAMFQIGMHYSEGTGGVVQDWNKSLKWLLKAAENGHKDAQYQLHITYGLGCGVPVDVTKSLEWCIRAAEQGHLGAQYFMHLYYSRKCHISPKDNTKFIKQCICTAWPDYEGIEILHNDYPQLYNRVIHRDINLNELLEMPEVQAVRKKVKDLLSR